MNTGAVEYMFHRSQQIRFRFQLITKEIRLENKLTNIYPGPHVSEKLGITLSPESSSSCMLYEYWLQIRREHFPPKSREETRNKAIPNNSPLRNLKSSNLIEL
jgi:hypothetical protein